MTGPEIIVDDYPLSDEEFMAILWYYLTAIYYRGMI